MAPRPINRSRTPATTRCTTVACPCAALPSPRAPSRGRWAVQLDFLGASAVTPRGEEPAPAVVSYFKGRDSASQTGLKTYGSVVYPDLWPGIDLVYTGTAGQLKYTFLVKPGADPDRIRLAYRGATAVHADRRGPARRSTRPWAASPTTGRTPTRSGRQPRRGPGGVCAWSPPRRRRAGLRLPVGRYDRSRPLVLDPAVLVYAGYIGGAGDDVAAGIAVDAAGNAYVVGSTNSTEPRSRRRSGPT